MLLEESSLSAALRGAMQRHAAERRVAIIGSHGATDYAELGERIDRMEIGRAHV